MIPRSLSATSVNVAELCLSRWAAEMFDKGAGIDNDAASLGSSVHGGLEMFVKECINGNLPPIWDNLRMFYMISFGEQFGWMDQQHEFYIDGEKMLKDWFDRISEFEKFEVLSCEVKETFPLKTSAGEIPFTYIFDRLDRTDTGIIRVVDYKTSRWNVTAEDLRSKVQARVYGLAAQIKFPEAERIWVQFEMLRHGLPVGVMFNKTQNRNTYRYLKAAAERIIKTDHDTAPESLNSECRFCVKNSTCDAVASSVAVGGVMSLDLPDMIDRYALLDSQRAAIQSALGSMESMITAAAKEDSWIESEGEIAKAKFKVNRRRYVDGDMVAHIIPPALWAKYGSHSITLKDFENLIQDPSLNADQRTQLKGMIHEAWGQPKLKVEMKKVGEDD